MLISVLIMAVLAVGAGVLMLSTGPDVPPPDDGASLIGANPEDDINSEHSLTPEPTPTPPPEEPEEPALPMEVTSVKIVYDGRTLTDFTQPRGVPIELRASIEPPGIDVEIVWESENPDVFEAVPVDVGGVGVKVTGIANGDAKLILRVGNQQAECWVRIRNP